MRAAGPAHHNRKPTTHEVQGVLFPAYSPNYRVGSITEQVRNPAKDGRGGRLSHLRDISAYNVIIPSLRLPVLKVKSLYETVLKGIRS